MSGRGVAVKGNTPSGPSRQHVEHSKHTHASGFGGQRGEHTWATRIKKLQELEFIDVAAGRSGPFGHAIIWNPHYILRWHHHIKTPGLTAASYNALIETALEVGASDMTVPWTPISPKTAIPIPVAPAPGTPAPPPPAPPSDGKSETE